MINNMYSTADSGGRLNTENAENGKAIAYNPSLAIKNLNDFNDTMNKAFSKLADAYSNLIKGLNEYWYSPNAVKFSSNHANYENIISNGIADCNSVIGSTVVAVASIARGCGSSFSYNGSVPKKEVYVGPLRERLGSFVGIRVDKVREYLETFKSEVKEGIATIESASSGIAVYDPSGSIRTLFGQRIASLKKVPP